MDGSALKDIEPRLEAAQEFLNIFNKGAQFLKEVVDDNQALRVKIASLESQIEGAPADASNDEQKTWQSKYHELLARIEEVEEENKSFLSRYLEIEEENNNLANLYIASYQLHSTLNFKEVLQTILEIVINLVGGERFCIYLLDEKEKTLNAVASEGVEIDELPALQLENSIVGEVIRDGHLRLFEDRLTNKQFDLDLPLAIIPLAIKGEYIGAIVVYQLLTQKSQFQDVDKELFHLLAGHAATAIFASKLYTESERKLSTMQGFIDLLTK